MRAYLFYSHQSGHPNIRKKVAEAVAFLSPYYPDIEAICTLSKEDARSLYRKYAGSDALFVILGGDGTLQNALDSVMSLPFDRRPLLAFLNAGTFGDAGKALGNPRSFRACLKRIVRGKSRLFDVNIFQSERETRYFLYSASVGRFSDIPYKAKRRAKRRFGRLSYYLLALRELFKMTLIEAEVDLGEGPETKKAPFFLFLSGPSMAGFRINRHFSLEDGLLEAYFPHSPFLGGLLAFLPFPLIRARKTGKFHVNFEKEEKWSLDGELALGKAVSIVVFRNSLRIVTGD